MANKDRMLTFEEFKRERNSFGLHFVGEVGKHPFGDVYRDQAPYKKCMEAHRGFTRLAAELRQMKTNESPEYVWKLYKAYRLMHPYAETNWEMFA